MASVSLKLSKKISKELALKNKSLKQQVALMDCLLDEIDTHKLPSAREQLKGI